jgi:MarR family transcriptional regulator, transcriptional regulator for hemolysin
MGEIPNIEAMPPGPLSDNLGWLLWRVSHNLATEVTAALESIGISPRAKHVLKAASTGEHTQIELARMVGVDKTTMVVTLDELEEAGLAERLPSPTDRRVRVIAVTAAGKRKLKQAQEISERLYSEVLDSLPAEQREAVLDGLAALVTGRLAEPVPCEHPVRQREPRVTSVTGRT